MLPRLIVRSIRPLGLGIALLALPALHAAAQTPPPSGAVQLPQTGQVKCWDPNGAEIACAGTGQDGELRAGVAWPSVRFTPGTGAEADCIIDNLTGLMWPRSNPTFFPRLGQSTWDDAMDFMLGFNFTGFCGHTDWRLPNILELESLARGGDLLWLANQGFRLSLNSFWSSTSSGATGMYVQIQDNSFSTGWGWESWRYIGVLPVHTATTQGVIELPRTGQTSTFRPYDDGFYQVGAMWPNPRFTVNGDTVTDKLTGLVWAKNANLAAGPMSWGDALAYVKQLNLCDASGGCYSDWRLPNRKELMSLIDYSRNNPSLPFDQPFDHVQPSSYWSSTVIAGSMYRYAQYVHFYWGQAASASLRSSDSFFVWPVRGGEVGFTHAITGTVTIGGSPIVGVSLELGGASWATTTTGAGGSYSYTFSNLASGVYTVRPSWNGAAFTPTTATVTVSNVDVQQNFTARVAATHAIAGTITNGATGTGLGGVSVALTGVENVTTRTAADGTYSIASLVDGSYDVTPTLSGYSFSPATAAVTLSGASATQDFSATIVAAPNPVELLGPAFAEEGGTADYTFRVNNITGAAIAGPFTLVVETSPGLQFTSESTDGWTCLAGALPGQYGCVWATDVPGGAATDPHTLTFSVASPYAPNCGLAPSPCVLAKASLVGTSAAAAVTTGVQILNSSTGGPNRFPDAVDDTASTIGTNPVTIAVLANDSDLDGDPLTVVGIAQAPSAGTVVINANGTITYTALAPLAGPDTFRYRVADSYGASVTALVTINGVAPTLTLSKSIIDIGSVPIGRLAAGRSAMSGTVIPRYVEVLITPVNVADSTIQAQLTSAGYDSSQAISDPDAFRANSGCCLLQVFFRPSSTLGRVSVARVVLTASEGGISISTSALVVGRSDDGSLTPVVAADDHVGTPQDTPVQIDVLANDSKQPGTTLYIASNNCANMEAVMFGPAPCQLASGAAGPDSGLHYFTYTPPSGFTGITTFGYGASEEHCAGCAWENNIYFATVTVSVGGARPNLVASKFAVDAAGHLTSTLAAQNGDPVVFRLGAMNQAAAGQPAVGDTTGTTTITDVLPTGLSFVAAGSDPQCTASAQVVTCVDIYAIPPNGSVQFDISTVVGSNVAAPGQSIALTNQATVSTSGDATAADNMSSAVTLTVTAKNHADLAVTMSANPFTVVVGQPVTISAVVTNGGPDPATQVSFTGLEYLVRVSSSVVVTTSQGTCPVAWVPGVAGTPIVCGLGTLAPSATATITIVATLASTAVTGTGSTSSVGIVADVSAAEADPLLTNNHFYGGFNARMAQADVAVTIAANPTSVIVGQPVTLSAVVTNGGPDAATQVSFTGLEYIVRVSSSIVVTTTQGSCPVTWVPGVAGTPIVCDLGTLASGATATISVVATLSAAAVLNVGGSSVGLYGDVSAAESDPVLTNNHVSGGLGALPASTPLPGGGSMTLWVPPPQTIGNVTVDVWSGTPPPGVSFPFGAISYTVTLAPGDATASTSLVFTPPLASTISLYKTDTSGTIVGVIPLCDGSYYIDDCWTRQDTTTTTTIVLILRDDGPFDLNRSAGVIEDPMLIGYATASPPTDTTAPTIALGTPVADAVYLLNQAVPADFSCTDAGSGVASCSGTVAAGALVDTSSVGTKTFRVVAIDAAANTSQASASYRVVFADGGLCNGAPGHAILDPITGDGSAVFKQGRVVPARFRVCDANGVSIGTPGVVSSFTRTQVTSGTAAQQINTDVLSTTPDTAFRWDPNDQAWIFNISTKGFASGMTYYFRITLSDGSAIDFRFGLK